MSRPARRRGRSSSAAPTAALAPELLFGGVGPGELFVARNAGNMVDTATMGTVEYGAEHLGAPLIVVLGHERCGAVVAACDVATKNTKLPGSIGPMVKPIVPAAMAMKGKPGDFVDNTVRESARRTAARLRRQPDPVASRQGREAQDRRRALRSRRRQGGVSKLTPE